MAELPRKVKEAFGALKRRSKQSIEIKSINKHFYVYHSTSGWDRERKKAVKISTYLGRIKEDGTFAEVRARRQRSGKQTVGQLVDKIDMLSAELAQARDKLTVLQQQRPAEVAYEGTHKSSLKYESTILKALSMNGRISMPMLGKMLGLSQTAAMHQAKRLERAYSIKYIAEIDVQKLGYLSFLIAVKFVEDRPSRDKLRSILESEPRIQLVMQTQSDYDLLAYVLAKSNTEAIHLVIALRMQLLEYKSKWNMWPLDSDYGTVPLREVFIDMLKDSMLKREYVLLKELIKDGRKEFSEIDKKYGFDAGRSQYSYHKLRESGLLKRVTITIQNLPIKYTALISASIIDEEKFRKGRGEMVRSIIEDTETPINKYLLVEDTAAPDGIIFFLPVFGGDDLDKVVENLNGLRLGMEFTTTIVTNLLIGEFCCRRFDNMHSEQQAVLEKEYGSEIPKKIDYEETGRAKKEARSRSDIRGLPLENASGM
jgi:DNA-binding Lrp family transcriptional regulator